MQCLTLIFQQLPPTGGAPAAGGLGLTLTGSGALAGILADLGLTALSAPYVVPGKGLANGVSAATNNQSCPQQ